MPAMSAAAGTGLTRNIAGALAYSLGIITGILFMVLEPYRRDRFVRFHAMQSILYFVFAVAFSIGWSIVVGILMNISGWVFVVAFPIRLIISLAMFGLWLSLCTRHTTTANSAYRSSARSQASRRADFRAGS